MEVISELDFERMIYSLVFGIHEKETDKLLYTISGSFSYGMNIFAKELYFHHRDAYKSFHERSFMTKYLTKPVKEWFDEWDPDYVEKIKKYKLYETDALLEFQQGNLRPTSEYEDICLFMCKRNFFKELEQNHNFQLVWGLSEELYSIVRKFIIEHPQCNILDIVELKTKCTNIDATYDELIDEIMESVYEDVPSGMHTCPFCGWTMHFSNLQAYCSSAECARKVRSEKELKDLSTVRYEKRVNNSIMHFWCLPGKLEKEIADGAEKRGCTTEWYPYKDEYDIKIILPSGKIYAIDAKTYRSPYKLKEDIMNPNDKFAETEPNLSTSECERYYVIPNEREEQVRGYCQICTIPEKPACITIKELWKRVEGDLKNGEKQES